MNDTNTNTSTETTHGWTGRADYAGRREARIERLHDAADRHAAASASAMGRAHDGTNYYTFREVREDRNIDILLGKLYEGKATRADINRYTRSLARKVGEVYGW